MENTKNMLEMTRLFCKLPYAYFGTELGRIILFPTLAILASHPSTRLIIEEEVNLDFLNVFFKKNPSLLSNVTIY